MPFNQEMEDYKSIIEQKMDLRSAGLVFKDILPLGEQKAEEFARALADGDVDNCQRLWDDYKRRNPKALN